MTNNDVLEKIGLELKRLSSDPRNVKDYSRFHKGGEKHIGLAAQLIKSVTSENFKKVRGLEKKQIFSLCERLLKTGDSGCRSIAFDWAFRIRKQYQKEDFKVFEGWVRNYVNAWDSCDDMCTHALGTFVNRFPDVLSRTRKWTKSPNKWFRRAAAVALIPSLRKGENLKEAFKVASILLHDNEDLVQKGYGWMLKEATKLHQQEVFDFVMKNKRSMPRTALRYAIEKMPKNLKVLAMAK